jgi:hypothetical protein
MPETSLLRSFLYLCETFNFAEAAERDGVSPAAFSDRISRLEKELGVRLFERTTRSVGITMQGRRLLPLARKIVALSSRCEATVNNPKATTAVLDHAYVLLVDDDVKGVFDSLPSALHAYVTMDVDEDQHEVVVRGYPSDTEQKALDLFLTLRDRWEAPLD